jgi:FkbM family methyltransferase
MPTRITEHGFKVIADDTHVSAWADQHGRLDFQEGQLATWLKKLHSGGIAVDVGACIGDTALTLSKAVGEAGMVIAIEPNPEAYECLKFNRDILMPNVQVVFGAVGDEPGTVKMHLDCNAGASHVTPGGDIPVSTLDHLLFDVGQIDFIKVDVEGYEPKVLRGAFKTLSKYKPDLLLEVNRGALERAGFHPEDIYYELGRHGYKWTITDNHLNRSAPQYDIFCTVS